MVGFIARQSMGRVEWWHGGIMRMVYVEKTGNFSVLGLTGLPCVQVSKKRADVHKLVSTILSTVHHLEDESTEPEPRLTSLEEQLLEDMRPVLGKVYKEEGLNDVSASAEMEHLDCVRMNYERVLRIRKQREYAQRNESLVQSALKGLVESGVSLSEVIEAARDMSESELESV